MRFPTRVPGELPDHHWTVTAASNSSIAHKGITAGAKAAGCTVYDLLKKPEVMAQIRKEFEEYAKEHPYKTFLPQDAEPPLGWNSSLMEKYRGEMEKYYINP
jgi:aminobenzoyl-glutamate utilization protein B